jgi:hypothetical protein
VPPWIAFLVSEFNKPQKLSPSIVNHLGFATTSVSLAWSAKIDRMTDRKNSHNNAVRRIDLPGICALGARRFSAVLFFENPFNQEQLKRNQGKSSTVKPAQDPRGAPSKKPF